MKRFACNRLYLKENCSYFQQVVELDHHACYVKHYSLNNEQFATQWLGGVFILLPKGVLPCTNLQEIFHWMKVYQKELEMGCPTYVWHLSPIDSIKAEINLKTKICQLK